MQIDYAQIEKLTIRPDRGLAVVALLEDHGNGRGTLTVRHDGDAWTHFWGNMGCDLRPFLRSSHPDYIVRKLQIGIKKTVADESAEALVQHARAHIIERRRQGDLTRDQARELWDEAEWFSDDGIASQTDRMAEIFGDCWWEDGIPQKPNQEYARLRAVVEAVLAALRQEVAAA